MNDNVYFSVMILPQPLAIIDAGAFSFSILASIMEAVSHFYINVIILMMILSIWRTFLAKVFYFAKTQPVQINI
ncbi:hypothetical protein A3464_11380 [Enterobacter genomosp. O]|nr:hypothetical protein A3464_11380 [Enterobacter genomosp. O]